MRDPLLWAGSWLALIRYRIEQLCDGMMARRWPWCRPYDSNRRLCLGSPVWNGRCRKHVRRASERGEDI